MKYFLQLFSYVATRTLVILFVTAGIIARENESTMIKCFIIAGIFLIFAIWIHKPKNDIEKGK